MSITKRKNLKKKMIGCLCFALIVSGMAAAPDVPCLSGIGAVSVSAEVADPVYVSEVDLGQIVSYANNTENCPAGITAQYVNSNNTIELTLTNSGTYKFSGSNLIDDAYVDVKIIVPSGVTAAIEFAEGSTINNDYGGYAFTNKSKYSGMNIDGVCYIYDYAVPFKVEGTLTVSGDLSVDTYSYYGECTYYDKEDSFFYHTKHGNSAPLYEGEGTFTADYFTVKYVDDDGLTVDEQYFIGGERNVMPTDLALTNLDCLVADGKNFKNGGILSKDTTVTNHLDTDKNGECDICKAEIKRTVTFNTNGGSTIEAKSIRSGGTISAPTAPTKEGYTFGGWYADEACTIPYDFSSSVTENVILYAKWDVEVDLSKIIEYKDGSNVPAGITAQYVNSDNTIELTLTNSGTYKFKGSNYINGSYVDVKIIVPSGVTAAIEFAEGSTIKNDSGVYDTSNNGNYSGMKIDGWCYIYDYAVPFKVEGTLTVSGDLSVDTYSYYGECIFYDKDYPDFYHTKHGNSIPLYEGEGTFTADYFTVKYVDGDGLTVDEQYIFGGERNVMPTDLARANLDCLVADGKDFKNGGILSENTTVTNHLDTDKNGECDICNAEIKRTVTFNTNGGSTIEAKSIRFGGTISAPTAPTKECYTFGGWYTDEACTTPFDFGSAITSNTTLYAKWVVEFKMNEVLDGYFNDPDNYTPPNGVSIGSNDTYCKITLDNGSYKVSGSNFVNGAYIDVKFEAKYGCITDINFDDAAIINSGFYVSGGIIPTSPFLVWDTTTLNVSGKLSVDTLAYDNGSERKITDLCRNYGTFNCDFFTVKYVDEDGNVIDENYYLSGETYNVKPSSYLGTDEKLHNIADEYPCLSFTGGEVSEAKKVTARKTHTDENYDHKCDNCGISAKLTGIELVTAPTKTNYYIGQTLDPTGGQIIVSYEFGKDKTVDITADMVSGFDNKKEGKQTLTVTYGEKTVTFDVTVSVAKMTGIKISTMPKTSYFIGEKLDVTGGKITVTYEGGKTETVDLTAAMVSGFDSTKTGKQTLTVTYGGKTATFDITVTLELDKPVISAIKAGDGQVAVSWNAVKNAASYKVYYRLNGTTSWTSKSTTATSYTITGLTNGKKYDFLVVAFNGTVSSKWTNADIINATPAAAVTAPALPTVKATAGDAQVALSWNSVSNATAYKVYYRLNGTSKWASKGTTATSLTITGLTNGKKYDFLVVAFNGTVSSKWTNADIINATPAAATVAKPALPTGLKLAAGDGKITASWNAVNGASYYTVYTYYNGKYTKVGTPVSTRFTITGLTNNTKYGVLVLATNKAGSSDFTKNDVKFATPIVAEKPALPTGLKLAAGDGKITAAWNPVSGASHYTVYTYYNGKYHKVGTPVSTRYTITGLTNNTKYGVLVLATNKAGNSDFTKYDVKFATPVSSEKPALPTVKAAAGNAKVALSWNAVPNATGYKVYYRLNGTSKWTSKGTTGTSLTISGLTNGSKYDFLVVAFNGSLSSSWTNSDIIYSTPQA